MIFKQIPPQKIIVLPKKTSESPLFIKSIFGAIFSWKSEQFQKLKEVPTKILNNMKLGII